MTSAASTGTSASCVGSSRDEYLDEQTKEDNDADAKDSKADKDAGDDEDFSIDEDKQDELERRREYWSRRLDKDW